MIKYHCLNKKVEFMKYGTLETPNLILRKARRDDVDAIWKNVWCDDEISKWMIWQTTRTREEAEARIERTIKYQSENYAYFVCLKSTDEPIGFAGIVEINDGIFEESGICIAQKCQSRGYAKEVVRALESLIFNELGGIKFIYTCFNNNVRSKKVCQALGFEYFDNVKKTREWDGYEYTLDMYFKDKNMYENNK